MFNHPVFETAAILFLLFAADITFAQTDGSNANRSFLSPCKVQNVGDALCGKYEVWENRSARSGRKIGLKTVVVPALNQPTARDAIFWLHGGPGAAATTGAGAAGKGGFLEKLRETHDIVFVDQRGTDGSNGLNCSIGDDPKDLKTFFGPLFPSDSIKKCRADLERTADLTQYTTPTAMDDLDEIRGVLGYEKIDLVAGSYGTIAALVYMRQHPEHLRSVFLLGVANTNIRQPLPFAAGAEHSMERLVEDCVADTVCHTAFPEFKSEFDAVLRRFDRDPVEAELIDPTSKQTVRVSIARGNFVERIRLLLYTTTFARFVPLIIHRAFQNDLIPFETMSIQYNPGGIIARGMYMTVTCSESVPFITPADIASTEHTFVGTYRITSHMAACREWVRGDVGRSFIEPVRSDVPVLMISGDVDASTPSWLGEEALKTLPNGRQVKIRYYGHQIDSPCVWQIMDDFVSTASASSVDTTCTTSIRRPPFATEIPKALRLN